MDIAILAIVRNEAHYLMEWIAWHRSLGISSFFLCDNQSTDGTSNLLAALDRAGIVTYTPFPDHPGERPQMAAYEHLLRTHGDKADWFCIIDADEFLHPAPDTTLPKILAAQAPDCGAVAVHWAIYGNSGILQAADPSNPGPVTQCFQRRAPQDNEANRWVKSILRSGNVDLAAIHRHDPHVFALHPGLHYALPSGRIMALDDLFRQRVPAEWQHLRLNHYMVKSHQEFTAKRLRGDAFHDRLRARSLFHMAFAANAIFDPVAPPRLRAMRIEKRLLQHHAERAGLPLDWRPEPLLQHGQMPDPQVTLCWSDRHAGFVLDAIVIDPIGQPILFDDGLWLRLGDHALDPAEIHLTPRPEIVAQYPWVSLWCGQRAIFPAVRPDLPCTIQIMRWSEVFLQATFRATAEDRPALLTPP